MKKKVFISFEVENKKINKINVIAFLRRDNKPYKYNFYCKEDFDDFVDGKYNKRISRYISEIIDKYGYEWPAKEEEPYF